MRERIKKINWINVVLFFSLALNFFVAGYLASDMKMLRNLTVKKSMHHRPEVRIVDYFPAEKRRELRHLMHEQRVIIEPLKMNVFASQRKLLEMIARKEVDEGQLREALREYQNANLQLQDTLSDLLVRVVMQMDYATRQKIYQRGQRSHERRNILMEQRHKELFDDKG